jgi:glutamyl-Q tRNA(Asp) synthetase
LVAALASWLDARAHHGQWLVRIEDVDTPRCVSGAAPTILSQLTACGLIPDDTPQHQSDRGAHYQAALDWLTRAQRAYPCACSRADIARTLEALGVPRERHVEQVYPGTCRDGLSDKAARAWRLRVSDVDITWRDRRLGVLTDRVADQVGDFVLKRADGIWAYQLAVVVDDAAQGVTHVVRGEDLSDNTARQMLLQHALDLPTPVYLHTPLVYGLDGEKLSKQHGAQAMDVNAPGAALIQALQTLGLGTPASASNAVSEILWWAVPRWAAQYPLTG